MVGKLQKLEMLRKLSCIIEVMPHSKNIKEIHMKTGIPTSTIQRYLNRKDLYEELSVSGFMEISDVDKLFKYSRKWLENAKLVGLKEGGIKSQILYGYEKDNIGHFKGRKK